MGCAQKSHIDEYIDQMTLEEIGAFRTVVSCLECPSCDSCLTSRRLFQLSLWQLADASRIEKQLAQKCQSRRSSREEKPFPAPFGSSEAHPKSVP